MRFWLTILIGLIYLSGFSQTDSTTSVTYLDSISVSVNAKKEAIKRQPQRIVVITPSEDQMIGSQNTADVLEKSGEVYIQRTQMGGGSPVLRGMEANKVLLMIDGVRLNNAITRSGHTQQSITIDNNMLQNMEVLYGAGSVLYGTGALGGSINFYTKDPDVNSDVFKLENANVGLKTASANFEKTLHANFNYGMRKVAFLTGFTMSNFDDLRMGANPYQKDEKWGLREQYVTQINGRDSIIDNDKPLMQKGTGYSQYNVLHKSKINFSENSDLTHTFIYTNSTDIPRYDKLTDYSKGKLKYAEWYYGGQKQIINILHYNLRRETKIYDDLQFIAAQQYVEESRNSRLFRDKWLFSQDDKVNIYSFKSIFHKDIGHNNLITYGTETYYNDVSSEAKFSSSDSASAKDAPTRFPNGDNFELTNAVYISYQSQLSEKWNLQSGIRSEYIVNHSTFENSPFIQLPFDKIEFRNQAIVVNIGINYLIKNWKFGLLLSRGFRSPNLDDYGKIRSKGGYIILPTDDLNPEKSNTIELNGVYFAGNLKISYGGFYSYLTDAIARADGQLNGVDSLYYDGEWNKIQFNSNVDKAYIYGANFGVKYQLSRSLEAFCRVNYTYGWSISQNAPLAHIPPIFGNVGVIYSKKKYAYSLNAIYNFAKTKDLYSSSGEDNLQYATMYGTPAWVMLNTQFSYNFNKFKLTSGVNNILDKHIRSFSSGVSQPGINLWLRLDLKF